MSQSPKAQLHMIWPTGEGLAAPSYELPDGYELVTYRPAGPPSAGPERSLRDEYYHLMALATFEGWTDETLQPWLGMILPNGWFFVVHEQSGARVASAMATHNPSELHPFGGELGWVAGHPDHAGRGLGYCVCAAVLNRFVTAGYERIYLKTDDHRLPALKTYLKLGFLPFLYAPDMAERWRSICTELSWPYTPAAWYGHESFQERKVR